MKSKDNQYRSLAISLAHAEADVHAARRSIDSQLYHLELACDTPWAAWRIDGTPQIVRHAYGQGAL